MSDEQVRQICVPDDLGGRMPLDSSPSVFVVDFSWSFTDLDCSLGGDPARAATHA